MAPPGTAARQKRRGATWRAFPPMAVRKHPVRKHLGYLVVNPICNRLKCQRTTDTVLHAALEIRQSKIQEPFQSLQPALSRDLSRAVRRSGIDLFPIPATCPAPASLDPQFLVTLLGLSPRPRLVEDTQHTHQPPIGIWTLEILWALVIGHWSFRLLNIAPFHAQKPRTNAPPTSTSLCMVCMICKERSPKPKILSRRWQRIVPAPTHLSPGPTGRGPSAQAKRPGSTQPKPPAA
jgi:hypothetical protein